jgi:hypothetical protein
VGEGAGPRASSGDAQRRPRSNHFSTASGCFARSLSNVGNNSSRSRARKAVGESPMRIVQ